MFELVEIELTRVRRMAEQTSDDLLLYMIEMAIIEAKAKARASSDSLATPVVEHNEVFERKLMAAELLAERPERGKFFLGRAGRTRLRQVRQGRSCS